MGGLGGCLFTSGGRDQGERMSPVNFAAHMPPRNPKFSAEVSNASDCNGVVAVSH